MKNISKFLSMLLAIAMVLSGTCASAETVTYERGDDEAIYMEVLGEFSELMEKARGAATIDERFVLEAQAEAYLLNSAAFVPTTTQNGAYTISRVAPRTKPYVQWGNDDDRLFGLVISDTFLTPDERNTLLDAWAKAVAGEGTYDPAKLLTDMGHTIQTTYKTTFSTAPVTLDWLNTSSQSDTEITVNTVEGLIEYNNLGQMMPALAESWEISEDGLTYTFNIRKGVKWYTSEGTEYADVTARDFVAGMHHMLDTKAGLEFLVDGVIAGVHEYLNGGTFDEVGYVATDDYTLTVTLTQPTSYFMTMLAYSCFLPMCEDWYLSHGGAFGMDEYQEAFASAEYTYGKSTDVSSQVYCGPYLLQKLNADSEIVLVKNPNYYDADQVNLETISWIYDNGENPAQTYKDVCDGVYAGSGLSEASGTLALAKADGNFDKYAYISETTSTTYFGGFNMNRGTFGLESGAGASAKTEQEKIDTQKAIMNLNFRKAVAHAFDRATQNAVVRGEDLKSTNLRNMYTHPEFVQLSAEYTDADGFTFSAGTMYGQIVQHYLDKMNANIKVADGQDGWYNPELAKECLAKAKEELGDTVTWPIKIDVVYYSPSANITAQAQATKQVIEACLGTENVVIELVETTIPEDYYALGYRASDGASLGSDFFYGSGWGPDYGDPCSYLDTFAPGGYMLKTIGLDY